MKRQSDSTSTIAKRENGSAPVAARREFLQMAPLAGLAFCLPATGAQAAPETKRSAAGHRDPVYRETETIRAYYNRARY